MLGILGICG